ncbi:hypothetical protein D9757_007765 [Collybiopsis confluens]|nr:hypothetical protein D9757_007765 [Collybiopsis confluens]
MLLSAIIVGCIICTSSAYSVFQCYGAKKLPPGPTRNLAGKLPAFQPWRLMTEWNRKYGPVILFRLGSQRVVVIGTMKAARDLLEKRGHIYSGRPRAIIGHEIFSPLRGIGMSEGPQFRKWKTFLQAGLAPSVIPNYQALQSIECFLLLNELLEDQDPFQFRARLRRFSTSVIFCLTYGRRIKSLQEDVVLRHNKSGMYFASVPGKFLVDSRFLQWFRWEPERHRAMNDEFYLALMNEVKDTMKDGTTAHKCMATYGLEKQEEFGLTDLEAAYTLSAPWSAGVGTTATTIEVFLLAMQLYPDVMRKAQREIDNIVGHDRMPGFQDAHSLPYVQALIKETTRWRCLAPLGFTHATTAEDEYEGMYIPKGSTVYGNIFSMTRDENTFPEPDKFRPERFLDTNDPRLIHFTTPFGFGRRLCPGMQFALQVDYIAIVRILWAFNISPSSNPNGTPKLPSPDNFLGGLVISPAPFECLFIPRSTSATELILREAEQAEIDAKQWP